MSKVGRVGLLSKAVVHVMTAQAAVRDVDVWALRDALQEVETNLRRALDRARAEAPPEFRATHHGLGRVHVGPRVG